MFLFVVTLVISLLIAFNIGEKREIGWKWSLFFLMTTFFIIGLALTLGSPKKVEGESRPNYRRTWVNGILGYLFVIIGLFFSYRLILILANPEFDSRDSIPLGISLSLGCLGLGLYGLGVDRDFKNLYRDPRG